MPASVVIGAQWGDEGKGKIVDLLAEKADAVIRYGGGPNAGHTIVVDGKRLALHLVPSGSVHPGKKNIIGQYVVCDLDVLHHELADALTRGAEVFIDDSAPVILPVHRLIDGLREKGSGSAAIGTTKRGVGPAYEDVASRRNLTLGDLRSADAIFRCLKNGGYYDERLAVARHLGASRAELVDFSTEATVAHCLKYRDLICEHLADTRAMVWQMMNRGEHLLFEGAQGVMLDINHGARPYITSSMCGAAAVTAIYGIKDFKDVWGVTKAYATRVGGGPFPTELKDEVGDRIRETGGEYGTTTGRPRRCGWLDLCALKYACHYGLVTKLAITKLDVLSGIPEIKFCHKYEYDGSSHDPTCTLTNEVLEKAKPIFLGLLGFDSDISGCRDWRDLPSTVIDFLKIIDSHLSVRTHMIGVGSGREQIIQF